VYISRGKSGNYFIYYRQPNSKKTRKSTGTKFKSEALKFLSEFEKKLKLESDQGPSFTMNQLKVKYLGMIEVTHSQQSWRHSRHSLERFIKVVGGDTDVKDITRSMAESFILNAYQRSKWSASLQLRHLKAIFNRAIDWGYIVTNPFKGIKLKIPVNHLVFINKKELELIASKETNHTLALLYRFAFYSGMRLGKIVNLEWDDVDMKAKLIQVKNKDGGFTTKSKRERTIPVSKPLKKILKNVKSNGRYVFSKNGERFNPTYASRAFKKCVRTLDLNDKIHFHTLRHSFASNLAQRGVNLYVIQKLLGHSKITTTQIYSHLRTEDLVKAINELK
jgi:integrase